jgi:hypothetical protein
LSWSPEAGDGLANDVHRHRSETPEDGRTIALQSLSNTQLIQILQHHDGDDDLTQMVEEELARRKTDGAPP